MKTNNITMNINSNTKNNRIEIVFSEKPSREVLDAIKGINFVYRNIGGKLMWLCTAKYLVTEDYNAFIKEFCGDFKKVVTTDGKPNKVAKPKAKKTTTKKTANKTTKDDRIAELERQLAELKAEVEAMAKPQLTAKRIATDNSDSNAPKSKYQLIVNGRVIR